MVAIPNRWPADAGLEPEPSDVLAERSRRFRRLLDSGMTLRFPQGIDVALEYQGDLPVEAFAGTWEFIRLCQSRHANFDFYQVQSWTPESVARGALASGTTFTDLFLAKLIGQFHAEVKRRWPHLRQVFDASDVHAAFFDSVLQRVGRFQAGRISERGIQFHCFDSFLTIQAYQRARYYLLRDGHRRLKCEPVDEGESSVASYDDEPEHGDGLHYVENDKRGMDAAYWKDRLLRGLRLVLADRHEWEMFHALAYKGETTRSLAAKLGISNGTVSNRLAAAQERLADFAFREEDRPRGALQLGPFLKAWRICVSEEVFLRLVPRPAP